jgi:hypothetical protein
MAIFQNQPINLDAIKGISPERFVQQAEREQQAIVGDFFRMQQGIQQGIQQFEQKREEKQNMEISLRMLKEMGYGGMSDDALKAGIKSAGGPMQFLEGMTQIQAARTTKLSAFQEKVQALIRAGFSPQEATMRATSGQTIQVGPSGAPSIDPTLLKQQIDADNEVLNKEILPAINAQPFVNKMEELLNKEGIEGVITGQLAKPELFLKAVAADLGMNFPDVATTQEYMATAGRQVGSIIRLFGAGTGLSDADRQYAERIAGGDINVPIDALKRIVRAAKESSLGQINRYNTRVKRKYSPETGLTPQQASFALSSLIIPEEDMALFQSPEVSKQDEDPDERVESLLNDLGVK